MSTPYTIEGTLTLPEGTDLPTEPIPFTVSNSYNSRVEYELAIPVGSGTLDLDFGTMPAAGCKAIMLTYETQTGAAPIQVTFNSSLTPIEISQGGMFLYASQNPVAGITSMSVAYTTAGKVRIWILG